MEVIFEQEYLYEMYREGKTTDKRHRFQPEIIKKYKRVVQLMLFLDSVPDLARYNALRYEKLKGDKAGLSSVRVNDQYRIEFREKTTGEQTIATICAITE
jgi:proteic killer suppression protein